MTPKQKSNDLVDQGRIILMNEDTDFGNEILCTLIAVKFAKIIVKEMIESVDERTHYAHKKLKYWYEVLKELDEL